MKILIISNSLPFPPNTGEKIRNFNLIKRLSNHHKVSLVSLITPEVEDSLISELRKYCASVETVVLKKRSKMSHLPGVIWCLLSGKPLDATFTFLREMGEKIGRLEDDEHFDIIQIEHSFMAPYIKAIPKNSSAKRVLVFHNIGFIQFMRMYKVEKNFYKRVRFLFNWIPMRRWEAHVAENFDKCLATSSFDKRILQTINQRLDIAVIPNGVDTQLHTPLPKAESARNLLYMGTMDYHPNIDAVLYFYKEIFPKIKKNISDCKLFIVGRRPPQAIRDLQRDKSVEVVGFVENIQPFYEQSAVSIVPLRAASGTRLKILESMALGRPVVSTSVGCEGLNVAHKKNILVADNPSSFARNVTELLTDSMLWQRIRNDARKFVEENYSWDGIAEQLLETYAETITKK
ncbi:glycosyltransferase family 4 protein [Candidatus Omnitrophota bacterium]